MTAFAPEVEGYLHCRTLPDGSHLCIIPETFGTVKLTVTTAQDYKESGHYFIDKYYSYDRVVDAFNDMIEWEFTVANAPRSKRGALSKGMRH